MVTDAKRKGAEELLHVLDLPLGEAGWARDVRATARARLLEAGAPVRRDEYWKYTDPARLTAPLALAEVSSEALAGDAASGFDELDARRIRFVNGRYRPDLSDEIVQGGLSGASLGEVLGQDLSFAREVFGRLEAAGQEKVARPLAALNTACATQGLVLQAAGDVAQPLHLSYDQIGDGASMIHHVIRVEAKASLVLFESGVPSNSVLEIDIGDGGSFHHIRVQTDKRAPSANHIFARLGAEARFKSFTLTTDGTLTRNETVMELVGDNGSGHVAGAVLGRGDSHIDNTIFVTHTGEHCESRQVFKNVLTEKAKGVFQGKIFVRPDAQKTDGYQISQSLVLDEGAEFAVKPELEIYADDVQCSHGSTTGALDETALFYLRSRGVPQRAAETMLVAAFVDEAIDEISDDRLAAQMRAHVAEWMAVRS